MRRIVADTLYLAELHSPEGTNGGQCESKVIEHGPFSPGPFSPPFPHGFEHGPFPAFPQIPPTHIFLRVWMPVVNQRLGNKMTTRPAVNVIDQRRQVTNQKN
jgi:hypothetical protein